MEMEVDNLSPAHAELNYMHECYAAVRDHLGGKPELAGELVEALRPFAAIELSNLYDEADNESYTAYLRNADAADFCRKDVLRARALLSRIQEQSDG